MIDTWSVLRCVADVVYEPLSHLVSMVLGEIEGNHAIFQSLR